MKNIIQSVKGTRDFYPPDKSIHSWLYNNIREVSESCGYQEYDGPFLESMELYAASVIASDPLEVAEALEKRLG